MTNKQEFYVFKVDQNIKKKKSNVKNGLRTLMG